MRYLRLPEPILNVVHNAQTGETVPYSFVDFFLPQYVWTNASIWRDGSNDAVESFFRVEAAFKGKAPGDVVELETEDFERLKQAVIAPNYDVRIVAPIMRFVYAVTSAATQRPTL